MNDSKIWLAHRKRLINIRLENSWPCHTAGLIFIRKKNDLPRKICLPHQRRYFEKVQDSKLMQNKQNGTYRPTFYCLRDEKTSLLWLVPLSSRVEKFRAIHDKQVRKYGRCLTIVLGEFDGREVAFLLQNMFPVREYYLDHIHTRNNNPVPVKHSIHREVSANMKRLRQLHARGKKSCLPRYYPSGTAYAG